MITKTGFLSFICCLLLLFSGFGQPSFAGNHSEETSASFDEITMLSTVFVDLPMLSAMNIIPQMSNAITEK